MSSLAQTMWNQLWDSLAQCHGTLEAVCSVTDVSTEEEIGSPGQRQAWSRCAVEIIVAVKTLCGLIRTCHARNSDFTYSVVAALTYLADMFRCHAPRYVGHTGIVDPRGDDEQRRLRNSFDILRGLAWLVLRVMPQPARANRDGLGRCHPNAIPMTGQPPSGRMGRFPC